MVGLARNHNLVALGVGEPTNLLLVLLYPHLHVLKPTEQIPFVPEHPFHPAALSRPSPDHFCG